MTLQSVLEQLSSAGTAWLPSLLDVAAKGMLVMALTSLAAMMMRRSSAATRHLIWFLGTCSLLLLPLLCAALPGWHILPQWALNSPAQEQQPAVAQSTPIALPPQAQVLPMEVPIADQAPSAASTATMAQPHAMTNSNPWSWERIWRSLSCQAWLMLAWATGALLLFAHIALGFLSLRWLEYRSTRLLDDDWTAALGQIRHQLGIRRQIILLASERRAMPMTWGLFRTRLLLPADSLAAPPSSPASSLGARPSPAASSSAWSPDQRRAVLLHELAHAKRHDCLTQFLVQITCALHWFNPLVWLAWHRIQTERERACDDLVLTTGTKPSAYAEQLLRIASETPPLRYSAAAIAMARPGRLEGRLLAILDTARNRRATTFGAACVTACLVAGLIIPLAMVRAQEQLTSAMPPTSKAASASVAQLPNGIAVELLGVCEHPSAGKQWWRPDGSALADAPYDDRNDGGVNGDGSLRELAVRVVNKKNVELWCQIPASGVFSQGYMPKKAGHRVEELQTIAASFPKDTATAVVRFGTPAEEWKTVATNTGRGHGPEVSGPVVFTPMAENDGGVQIFLNHNITDRETRLLAVGTDGRTSSARVMYGRAGEATKLIAYTFRGLKPEQIREFQFQTCRFEWAELNAALQPGSSPPASGGKATADQPTWSPSNVAANTSTQPAAPATISQATLPGDNTVELLAISPYPDPKDEWWLPDGSPSPRKYQTGEPGMSPWPAEGGRRVVFHFAKALPDDAHMQFRYSVPCEAQTHYTNVRVQDLAKPFVLFAAFPSHPGNVTIRMGQASGPWRSVATYDPRTDEVAGDLPAGFVFKDAKDNRGSAEITVARPSRDLQLRLVAVDANGGDHQTDVQWIGDSEKVCKDYWRFERMPLSRIKSFRLESREYQWVEFANIATMPATAGVPAQGPATRAAATQPNAWGPVAEGVSLRLRTTKGNWLAEEAPPLAWDIRNEGTRQFLQVPAGDRLAQLEVDGVWYVRPADRRIAQLRDLGVGASLVDQAIDLSSPWQKASPEELEPLGERFSVKGPDKVEPLELSPGRHTFRLATIVQPSRANTGNAIRVVSAPLTVGLPEVHFKEVPTAPATTHPAATADHPATQAASAHLDFRIIVGRGQAAADPWITPAQASRLIAELVQQGPDAANKQFGKDYAWFPVDLRATSNPQTLPIAGQFAGRWYVLASSDPKHTMLADENGRRAWGLVRAHVSKNELGRPAVDFEFDQAGADRFGALTANHLKRQLAAIVDGQVVSVATIQSAISRSGIISQQNMTEKEAADLAAKLQNGMPAVIPPALPKMVRHESKLLGLSFDCPESWIDITKEETFAGDRMALAAPQPVPGDVRPQVSFEVSDNGVPTNLDLTSKPNPSATVSKWITVGGVPARITGYRLPSGPGELLMLQIAKGTKSYTADCIIPSQRREYYLALADAIFASIHLADPSATTQPDRVTQAAMAPLARITVLSTPQDHAQGNFHWRVEPDRPLGLEFRCDMLDKDGQVTGSGENSVTFPDTRPVEVVGSRTTKGGGTVLHTRIFYPEPNNVPELVDVSPAYYFGDRGDTFASLPPIQSPTRLTSDYTPFAWADLTKASQPVGTVFCTVRVISPDQKRTARDLPTAEELRVPSTKNPGDAPTSAVNSSLPTQTQPVSDPPATPVAGAIATFSNGISAELLGICTYPSTGKQWWRLDGQLLPSPPADLRYPSIPESTNEPLLPAYSFAVRITNPNNVELKRSVVSASFGVPIGFSGDQLFRAAFTDHRDRATIRIGAALEPWNTIMTADGHETTFGVRGHVGVHVLTTPSADNRGEFSFRLSHDFTDRETRLVILTTDGQTRVFGTEERNQRYSMSGFKPDSIHEFQFQTCRFEWKEFKDIPLRPRTGSLAAGPARFEWRTAASAEMPFTKKAVADGFAYINFTDPRQDGTGTMIRVDYMGPSDRQTRLIAITNDGSIRTSDEPYKALDNGVVNRDVRFSNLALDQIRAFAVQVETDVPQQP